MNKALRHELKMLKYKKRINQMGLAHSSGKFYAYRSHGKPCSCSVCSPNKRNNSPKHADLKKIFDNMNDIIVK